MKNDCIICEIVPLHSCSPQCLCFAIGCQCRICPAITARIEADVIDLRTQP